MNKYEENISDIITLDAPEEIVDIFLEHVADTDDNVGLIANKELIEYAMSEALSQDWINIQKVDLELDDNIEYMISINGDGNLVVQPVTEYSDKYFSAMEYVYISMDGDVEQMTIDNCINRDIKVVLFGYEDNSDEEDYTVNGQKVDKETFDNYVSKFAPDKVKEPEDKSDNCDYFISVKCDLSASEVLKIIQDMERRMEHMNDMFREMDNFRRLFNW